MIKKIVDLTKNLISYKTTSDNYKELNKAINFIKKELNNFTIKTFEKNKIKSLLIYNQEPQNKKFRIILNGHLDIISGKNKQYEPKIIGNRLYGVGSLDMKGGLSVVVCVFKEIAKSVSYPIALQITTDEEVGGFYGTKYQIEKGVNAEFAITAEPTNLDIVYKAKGILWLKINFYGKSFHSAYPWNGKNAIEKANSFINKLLTEIKNPQKNKWKTTINFAHINSNNKTFNKIPDACELWLDVRFIPEEKNIFKKITNLVSKKDNLKIEVNEPSFCADESNQNILKLRRIAEEILSKNIVLRGANGSSDARHYSYINVPAIEFGPKGGGIGSDDEYVEIESLSYFYKIIKKFLLKL
jgi:succinyl-diaminopimelate desuccinylase